MEVLSINDVLAIIAFLTLTYTIFYNLALFAKNKIISDIFDEINKTNELNKLLVKKTTYIIIYIIGFAIFPILHIIKHIISIICCIIIVSALIIFIIAYLQHRYNIKVISQQDGNNKSEIKILNYKVESILFNVYILLFIFILVASMESLPYTAFISIPLLLFYLRHYLFKIVISFYIVIFVDEGLFIFAIIEKYDNIKDILIQPTKKLWIKAVLKNGEKISGDLVGLDINFLKLRDIENINYNIKYKQIEVIGSKYYPLYVATLKTDDI